MTSPYAQEEPWSTAINLVSTSASDQLKLLLETKHLYQRVSFDPTQEQLKLLAKSIKLTERQTTDFSVFISDELPKQALWLAKGGSGLVFRGGNLPVLESVMLVIDNIKIACSDCKGREAFAPVFYNDVHRAAEGTHGYTGKKITNLPECIVQSLVLGYQCQRCRSEIAVFTVTRRGWFLTLEGRSPIEPAKAPKSIPKQERPFFWEATVARNAGRTLAALFFLRTCIEQFARRVTGSSEIRMTGEDIMDAYAETLPSAYRGMIPSLKEWYSKLSEAIHAADGDEELLEDAMREIERHFDARKVFYIPDPNSKAAE